MVHKVILHGEHSVVYGKLALAASIDLRTKVIIKLSSCKKRLLRVNLLNYSKKSLDFDLQVIFFFQARMYKSEDCYRIFKNSIW